jgi:hypothetical protein
MNILVIKDIPDSRANRFWKSIPTLSEWYMNQERNFKVNVPNELNFNKFLISSGDTLSYLVKNKIDYKMYSLVTEVDTFSEWYMNDHLKRKFTMNCDVKFKSIVKLSSVVIDPQKPFAIHYGQRNEFIILLAEIAEYCSAIFDESQRRIVYYHLNGIMQASVVISHVFQKLQDNVTKGQFLLQGMNVREVLIEDNFAGKSLVDGEVWYKAIILLV